MCASDAPDDSTYPPVAPRGGGISAGRDIVIINQNSVQAISVRDEARSPTESAQPDAGGFSWLRRLAAWFGLGA